MKIKVETPHRCGDNYTSHAGYVKWLHERADRWLLRGDMQEHDRIRALANKVKQRGPQHCPVCLDARATAAGLPRPGTHHRLGFR